MFLKWKNLKLTAVNGHNLLTKCNNIMQSIVNMIWKVSLIIILINN